MSKQIKKKENYFVAARRQMLQNVKEIIRETGVKGVEHKRIMAQIKMLGASDKSAADYLDTLHMAGFIKFDTGRWFIVQTETSAGTKEA